MNCAYLLDSIPFRHQVTVPKDATIVTSHSMNCNSSSLLDYITNHSFFVPSNRFKLIFSSFWNAILTVCQMYSSRRAHNTGTNGITLRRRFHIQFRYFHLFILTNIPSVRFHIRKFMRMNLEKIDLTQVLIQRSQ